MFDTQKLWKEALSNIEDQLSKANFSTWFKNAYIVKNEDGTLYISFPNNFVKDWVSNKYNALLLKTLRNLSNDIRAVEYVVSKSIKRDIFSSKIDQQPIAGALPLQDLYINKQDNLNPRYDFESFIVGSFNELAHAAAQQILKNLGTTYNPLFIYGRTGYGKTHLVQAIGNDVKTKKPHLRVYYITSEKFAQDLVNSLQSNKINNFKEKYRKYDVFIIDDIQFLSNKEKTQEELFHLFNTLHNNNKQIVLSSDQHPTYIPGLEERLKSRFSAGMVVDISAPDKESRTAILKSKAKSMNFALSEDVFDHLATTIDGNIRELEGALNAIVCQSQLKQKNLTLQEVKNLLKNISKPKKMIPIEDVVKKISSFYNVEEESIYKKTRKKEIVRPRQLIM